MLCAGPSCRTHGHSSQAWQASLRGCKGKPEGNRRARIPSSPPPIEAYVQISKAFGCDVLACSFLVTVSANELLAHESEVSPLLGGGGRSNLREFLRALVLSRLRLTLIGAESHDASPKKGDRPEAYVAGAGVNGNIGSGQVIATSCSLGQ